MKLEHGFTVPVGIDDAWKVLLDVETIAPCMPGAALGEVDGDNFTGTVKVKLGPISMTYTGKASFTEKDETAHKAVIEASGKDKRGGGTAAANVTATLTADAPAQTTVSVVTDLNITGKPAQFGRGVMADVGNKLIGQFADCLAAKIEAGEVGDGGGSPDASAEGAAAGAAGAAGAAAGAEGAASNDGGSADAAPAASHQASSTPAPSPTASPTASHQASESAHPAAEPARQTAAVGSGSGGGRHSASAGAPAPKPAARPASTIKAADSIDLLDTVGIPPAAKMAGVGVVAFVLGIIVSRLLGRR